MTKHDIKQAWMDMMKSKYNTDEAGVSAIMRSRQLKGNLGRKGKNGGFNSPEIAKKANKLSLEAQRAKAKQIVSIQDES